MSRRHEIQKVSPYDIYDDGIDNNDNNNDNKTKKKEKKHFALQQKMQFIFGMKCFQTKTCLYKTKIITIMIIII
ncbi:hypothetical protein RFI_02409 [Reticulomyxa filosa]|uniref:Uncharacterized protein n=1 Tax=Reticulomyxa filosa TaxID=46433 RepID=X6P988_RETFI|nr:hypothetical protein RFI_02409 [Reticulomyxa filosa]|eukprot:ETO34678.1 hypothetical protein RFI_02409 [Reticulomyxa filosa]